MSGKEKPGQPSSRKKRGCGKTLLIALLCIFVIGIFIGILNEQKDSSGRQKVDTKVTQSSNGSNTQKSSSDDGGSKQDLSGKKVFSISDTEHDSGKDGQSGDTDGSLSEDSASRKEDASSQSQKSDSTSSKKSSTLQFQALSVSEIPSALTACVWIAEDPFNKDDCGMRLIHYLQFFSDGTVYYNDFGSDRNCKYSLDNARLRIAQIDSCYDITMSQKKLVLKDYANGLTRTFYNADIKPEVQPPDCPSAVAAQAVEALRKTANGSYAVVTDCRLAEHFWGDNGQYYAKFYADHNYYAPGHDTRQNTYTVYCMYAAAGETWVATEYAISEE